MLDARRLVARAQPCQLYQFCDPFDTYNSAALLYEFVQGTITFSSSYSRFAPPAGLPGQGVKFAGNSFFRKNLRSNQQTLIIKVALNLATLGSLSSFGAPAVCAWDNGTAQWSLAFFPTGAIAIKQGDGGSSILATTGPGVIAPGYFGVEVEVSISSSAGTAQVWLNGVQVLSATGLNTQQSSNAYANQVSVGDLFNYGLANMLADDFRVWDNTGSVCNAPLGTDSRLIAKLPSGVGAVTQWTPNGAAANWQCVDDNPPDGDSTYVSCSTVSDDDAYSMPSAGFTAAPVMVIARSYARKDDGATRSMQVGVDSSGSALSGGNFTLGSTYAFIDGDCSSEDPHTLAAWTAAGADAAQHWKQETA